VFAHHFLFYKFKTSIKDKYQLTCIQYGYGAVTNYAYNDSNRTLKHLTVQSLNLKMMDNEYTYDRVKNITKVENKGVPASITAGGGIGGAMTHNYSYDNLYRLTSANGTFTGYNGKTANYTLAMRYDNMHNITSKVQHITQTGVQFAGTLQAGYNLGYSYADNSQQITNIADTSYRAEGTVITPVIKTQQFSYDANGNLLSINTGTKSGSKLSTTNSRKMVWDEENRLLAVSDNGFVSNYWYDASGERTVKESGDNEGVTVNGLQSAGRSGTTNFTTYISPYLVVSNGGNYTKHIYMGGQRITSKVSNSGIFTASPVTTIDLQAKYTAQTAKIKERFDSLRVTYKGTPQSGGLVSKDTSTPTGSYFYHSDHLGSSSLITDASGAIVQHLEYVPFGETFIDERRSQSSWTTPYLFSGKERDEETGLLYFGARYQDSKYGIWYSVDPLAEITMESYSYCGNNPVNYIDKKGLYKNKNESDKYAQSVGGTSHKDNKTGNWFVPMDETGKNAYTSGGTLHREFGPEGNKMQGATTLSIEGLRFIQRHEGFGKGPHHKNPYNDSKVYATVGYGHLLHKSPYNIEDKISWQGITREEGLDLMLQDLAPMITDANQLVHVPLTQYQFDAIVSFRFNIGPGNFQKRTGFRGSNFLRELNKGNYYGDLMMRYHTPSEIIGRRQDEVNLFNTGKY